MGFCHRALAVLLALAPAATARATPVTIPGRYLIVEVDAAGTMTPVWERRVLLELPAEQAVATAADADKDLDEDAIAATVVDATGTVRYREVVHPAAWLRGEFAAGAGAAMPIEGHFLRRDVRRFVVRVPEIAGARLLLQRPGETAVEAPEAAPSVTVAELDAAAAETIVDVISATGSPANRLDLLVVGEGYTASQYYKFLGDVQAMLSTFFAASPYAEYRSFMNVTSLYITSRQEGADHPQYRPDCLLSDPTCCTDPAELADPNAGRFVDTAFDARFCSFGVQRLLTVNEGKVLAAASAAPNWDVIVVLVNDATYGGSGGTVAVVSTNAQATEIAKHELGHSFSELADEYSTAFPGYPGCTDLSGGVPCEANVTDETRRDHIKWSPWILPSTPLPTPPGDPAFTDLVGLFEGARYRTTGMYRPRAECLMRELGKPFCEVCRQAFTLRLYDGGWGVPATGVDPIEPGSETPAPGPLGVLAGATVQIQVQLTRPLATPSLDVAWLVDGVPVDGADGDHLLWAPPGPGIYRVELVVRDGTGFVHPDLAVPESRRAWTITVWSARHPRRQLTAGPASP